MRPISVFLFCCFFGLTLNGFTQSSTSLHGHDKAEMRTVIVQFKNNDFQKRSEEIVANLKGINGIAYLAHCDNQALFVVSLNTHLTGPDAEKIIQSKIPAGLLYDYKEGTLEQVTGTFSACLTEETL
jgi:hypothetical protein